jgi:hypothetical protein
MPGSVFFSGSSISVVLHTSSQKQRFCRVRFNRCILRWTKLAVMKALSLFFKLLYVLSALLVVPSLSYANGNAWYLFGILFSLIGTVCGIRSKYSFITLFALYCVGFWLISGFDIHDYTTFYFFCSLAGFLTGALAEGFEQLARRGTVTNDRDLAMFLKNNDALVAQAILEYQTQNPGKEINFDTIDAIVKTLAIKSGQLKG